MYKDKIILGTLIFIIIAMLSTMTFLIVTKEKAEKDIAKNKTGEDFSEQELAEIEGAGYEVFERPVEGEEIAVMKIKNFGELKIRLFRDAAPKAVNNFVGLAEKGYYDGVSFHRVIDNFMIQGGDPTGTGAGGESFFGDPFGPEYQDGYFPYRGTIAMASQPGVENSLTSQFFIVQTKPEMAMEEQVKGLPESIVNLYMKKGGAPHLYKEHTVFGYVYSGMDIVDEIAKVKTNDGDKPLKDVIIESVKIIESEDQFE